MWVAREHRTRVYFTMQCIPIHNVSSTDCIEMDDIETDSPSHPSILSKIPCFTGFEDSGNYMGTRQAKYLL